MYTDELGHIRWEKRDITKHGTVAKYLIGGCRCDPCKEHIIKPDLDKPLRARYNFD